MKKLLTPLLLMATVQANTINLSQTPVKAVKIDPLSKITVTSKKAVGKKEKDSKSAFLFSYLGDVKTVLADGSQITADQLDIHVDKEGISTQGVVSSLTKEVRQDALSQLKKISFLTHVVIKRDKQVICADRADLDPQKRCCTLQGNVSVTQSKTKSSDVPLNLKSDQAVLSLDTGTVTFLGSNTKPVSTVINVTDVKFLDKKDKSKKNKREQNKHTAAHEAQKIAAGEVIERPAHIIKELLENSLDAGATKIDIYLEQAGKKLIRIVDNGCGMSTDDARLCFVKHATSKVTSLDDLQRISSFGFRGEALASIAAVSKTTLKTKLKSTDQSALGMSIDYAQGQITQEQALACQEGTEFLIHDLFYNMPARRKFLRQDETEINQVQQLVFATSLSHLNVSFKFYVDDKLVLNAPASETLSERITQLWGYNTAQNLVPLMPQETKHTWVSMTGAVSQSSYWRHGRDRIFLFVNNRWIKDNDLSKAILKGYANALPPGKFPMAFIFITLEPGYVDINVHPKKEEVRFLKPGVVEMMLQQAVQRSLEEQITQVLKPEPVYHHEIATAPVVAMPKDTHVEPEVPKFSLPPLSFFTPRQEANPVFTPVITQPQKAVIQQPEQLTSEKNNVIEPLNTQVSYNIIGQLFNTYIMIEKGEECIVIDQHAAHERILYEQWKSNFEGLAGISLLFPEMIRIPEHQIALLMQTQDIFAQVGITLEQFGKQEVIIKTSPPKINGVDLSNTVKEAAAFLEEHETLDPQDLRKKLYEHMHSHMACKAAVRAGDILTQPMMRQLIDDLLTVENRFQCVHGRPTMWVIAKYDFEKKFRRC